MLLGLLGIIMAHLAHSRDTYQPTSIMRWNRGNHDNLIYWGLSVTVSVIMIHYGNSYDGTALRVLNTALLDMGHRFLILIVE